MSASDLTYLLREMQPQLLAEILVFVSLNDEKAQSHLAHAKAMIKENEGITLVLAQTYADNNDMAYQGTYQQISLEVHSDLAAVGLTAAFANALAAQNIPANVLAGYYHDHILVPESLSQKAVDTLNDLAGES